MSGLFNPNVDYDKYSGYGAFGMHTYLNADWCRIPWADRKLSSDLASRGVTRLRGYEYGRDMMAYDEAFHEFVDDFVRVYYDTDADVAGDAELQAVFAEATHPSFGKLCGFPTVHTIDSLVEVLTHVVVSVIKHHATNLRAFSEVQQVLPYASSRLNCAWPGKAAVTEAWIVQQCMPNLATAVLGIKVAAAFNRTFPVSYTVRHLPTTSPVGTQMDRSRARLARALDRIDADIRSRDDPILPYNLLLSHLLPISEAV
jgi:hypothetical protein